MKIILLVQIKHLSEIIVDGEVMFEGIQHILHRNIVRNCWKNQVMKENEPYLMQDAFTLLAYYISYEFL